MGLASLVDAVIGFTLCEGLLLLVLHRRTGKGVAPHDHGLNMLAGLCLMLALRCVVRDAATAWVATCLAGAGIAHGADLRRRWRSGWGPGRRRTGA